MAAGGLTEAVDVVCRLDLACCCLESHASLHRSPSSRLAGSSSTTRSFPAFMVRVSPDGTAVASELSGTPHDVPARRPAKRQRTSSLPTASDFWIDSLPGFRA